MKQNYRYPGAPSFQKEDAHIFFGRDRESKELLRLIRLEQMVVLYGKSGLGKTSLLNAGVLPKLEDLAEEDSPSYQCQKVRFFAWKDKKSQPPLRTFQLETVGEEQSHPLLEKAGIAADNLWSSFKSVQLSGSGNEVYVLVFDQFEELFTYPETQVEAFKRELANLLHESVPSDYKQQLRQEFKANPNAFSKGEKAALLQPVPIKVVLSIRSDRLSLLDKLTNYLPNALVNLYELQLLSRAQASAAILFPAAEQGDFQTPTFKYTDDTLTTMLNHLEDETGKIEPFQIQYLCEHAESIVAKTGKRQIETADLGNLSDLFSNYYNNKIAEIGTASEQKKVRHLLEDGLLFNEVRLSLLEAQITDPRGFNLPLALLQKLENLRLLRAERREDQTYYEITHDTLAKPIVVAKEKRQQQERRRRMWLLGGLVALVLGIGTVAFLGIYRLWQNAEEAKKNVIAKNIEIDAKSDSIQLASSLIDVQNDSIKAIIKQLQMALAEADSAKLEALAQNERFRKSFATYLVSEAEKAFEGDDLRLAMRLLRVALEEFDNRNEKARKLFDELKDYLAISYKNIFLKYGYRYSKNSQYFTFFTDLQNDQGILRVLDLNEGKIQNFSNSHIYNELTFPEQYDEYNNMLINYSNNSQFLTFFTNVKDNKGRLEVLNLKTGEKQSFFTQHNYRYQYSRDSKFLIFLTDIENNVGNIQALNLKTGDREIISDGYNSNYRISEDSQFLTFFNNQNLEILNLKTGEKNSFYNAYSLNWRYSNESQYLMFLSNVEEQNGNLNILNLKTANKQKLVLNNIFVKSYIVSENSHFLAYFSNIKDYFGNLSVLNLKTGKSKNLGSSYFNTNSYIFSEDGKYLAYFTNVKNYIGTLNILNLNTGETLEITNSKYGRGIHQYSKNCKFLTVITVEKDGRESLVILNLGTGERQNFPNSSTSDVINYSKDSQYLTFYSKKQNFIVLNLETGDTLNLANSSQLSYSGNSQFLTFSPYSNNWLSVLNLRTGERQKFHNNYSYKVPDFSKNSKFMTFFTNVKDKNGNLILLNLETGDTLSFANSYLDDEIYGFSEDSQVLAFLKSDLKTVIIYDLNESKVARILEHKNKVTKIKFSPNGHFLATFSEYPGSYKEGVLKITPTHLKDEDVFAYYDSLYAPLSRAERERYGLE